MWRDVFKRELEGRYMFLYPFSYGVLWVCFCSASWHRWSCMGWLKSPCLCAIYCEEVGRQFAIHDKAPCLSSRLVGYINSEVVMFAVYSYKITLYIWIIIWCCCRTDHYKGFRKKVSVFLAGAEWTSCTGWSLMFEHAIQETVKEMFPFHLIIPDNNNVLVFFCREHTVNSVLFQ